MELLVAGDFNRHDQLWGGDAVTHNDQQGEANSIIEFMSELGLQSLLPRSMKTFIGQRSETTIDLTLASARLAANLMQCGLHHLEHGSDH